MTAADIFVIATINVLVTLVVAGSVRWAVAKTVFQLKETRSELGKLRLMYGNVDHRITEVVKKNAAIEMIVTRAMHERLKAVEKAVTLTGNGTQS